MKRLLIVLLAVFAVMSTTSLFVSYGKNDVIIPWGQICTDAAFKQFKKANVMNQYQILHEMLRKANEDYSDCSNISDLRKLRERMGCLERYMLSAKKSFLSLQMEFNLLFNEVNKLIREYENGVTVYREASGYEDFGQELD